MCIRDRRGGADVVDAVFERADLRPGQAGAADDGHRHQRHEGCLLYTSDAADERSSVDLGGRRIIKKKNYNKTADRR